MIEPFKYSSPWESKRDVWRYKFTRYMWEPSFMALCLYFQLVMFILDSNVPFLFIFNVALKLFIFNDIKIVLGFGNQWYYFTHWIKLTNTRINLIQTKRYFSKHNYSKVVDEKIAQEHFYQIMEVAPHPFAVLWFIRYFYRNKVPSHVIFENVNNVK